MKNEVLFINVLYFSLLLRGFIFLVDWFIDSILPTKPFSTLAYFLFFMKQLVILVTGGTGFLGKRVVSLLQKNGHRVIVHHRGVQAIPTHADVIVNLVGVIREDEQTFKEAHVDKVAWVLRLGKKLGVRQFVQVSALGVPYAVTNYQKTKLHAEQLVKESGLHYVIVRPSMMFGKEDKSINMFRTVCRTGFFPLFANGNVQPVSVDVVAQLIVVAVEGKLKNRVVEVAGPEIFTYAQLADRIHPGVRLLKLPRFFITIITLFGSFIHSLPTKEQVVMLGQSIVTKEKTLERLGIKNVTLK